MPRRTPPRAKRRTARWRWAVGGQPGLSIGGRAPSLPARCSDGSLTRPRHARRAETDGCEGAGVYRSLPACALLFAAAAAAVEKKASRVAPPHRVDRCGGRVGGCPRPFDQRLVPTRLSITGASCLASKTARQTAE